MDKPEQKIPPIPPSSDNSTVSLKRFFSRKRALAIIGGVVFLVLIVFASGFFHQDPPRDDNPSRNVAQTQNDSQKGTGLFGQQCEGSGVQVLNTFPINPDDIELIVPMGRVQDSHVTPTDHQYIIPKGTTSGSLVTDNPEKYPIMAPADGYIINIELFKEPVEQTYRKDPYQDNYLVIFEHTCDFYTRLIHIDTLPEKVLSSFSFDDPESQHPYAQTRIPVKEGEAIGTVGPHSFDFQIMNMGEKNTALISPENIDWFSPYTVDTFEHVTDSLKSQLLPKNLRQKEPLSGKIGYDVAGTLLGNWFKVGRDKNKREEYWTNNLSVVYDHIDESQIRVSLGDFGGYPKAFGVAGNSPDPKEVRMSSGAVVYELVLFDYYDPAGNRWDTIHYVEGLTARNMSDVAGVVLFQLVDEKTLKVESFPGKTKSQMSGFTPNAKLYER